MPRNPDPKLKDKILDAADRLYRRQGEKGLTLRNVAKASETTTPTVYKRFRNRDHLLRALGNRARVQMFERFDQSKTLEELCEYYLDWAKGHRHEYRLVFGPHWPAIFASEPGEPGIEWGKEKLAKRFGGRPSEYDSLARWLRLLLHGAASLLVDAPEGPTSKQIRAQCLNACSAIITNAKRFKA
jgi:AcrR family transcriptional regulator